MSAIAVEQVNAKNATKRFYRPELDLLRLLAFALVFLAHGPRLGHSSVSWRQALFAAYNNGADSGIYGLCLFFFLSSYLITELLLREQETTGTVHLASFYRRRILRIWPLYYLAVGLSALCPLLLPDSRFNWHQILYLLLFVGYLGKTFPGNPFGVLWSISVEELFYALWPWLVRWGRTTLIWVSLGLIVLSPLIGTIQRQADFWYNPLAHFLFFAGGALTALWLHGRLWQRSRAWRIGAGGIGLLAIWGIPYCYLWPSFVANPLSFLSALGCCLLLFLAIFDLSLPDHWTIRSLLYLGRISYGLYVFHLFCYSLVRHFLVSHFAAGRAIDLVLVQVPSMVLTIVLAALSYRYWERPFLRLKERFTFVRSRDTA